MRKYKPDHIKRWLNFVGQLPCVCCGSPANIHHLRPDNMPRNDLLVIPVCKFHHQDAPDAIHKDSFAWQSLYGSVWNNYTETLDQYLRSLKK